MMRSIQEQLTFEGLYFPQEFFLFNGKHIIIVMQLTLDKLLLFAQFDILFFKLLDPVFLLSHFVSQVFNHGQVS